MQPTSPQIQARGCHGTIGSDWRAWPLVDFHVSASSKPAATTHAAPSEQRCHPGCPSAQKSQACRKDTDESAGATTLTDSIRGASGDGTLVGYSSGGTFVSGIIGNALEFNGADQYVTAPLAGGGLQETTVSAWVKLNGFSSNASVVKNWGTVGAVGAGAWHLGLNGNSLQWSDYVGNGSQQFGVVDPNNAGLGTWYNLVATVSQSANRFELWVDGQSVGSDSFFGTVWNGFSTMAFGVKLNGSQTGPDSQAPGYLAGQLDEIAFWDTALTGDQIGEIYTAGLNGDSLSTLVVPEPSTVFSLAAGAVSIGGLTAYRRRRVRASRRS
jgi:hypothetical protein